MRIATTSCEHPGNHLRLIIPFLVGMFALTPVRAGALEMAWPLGRPAECVLAFGAAYRSGEGSATHRGIDLAAESGGTVLAPAAAVVSFVGTVPAVGGGTVTALTLATGDGVSITLLPLSAVEVRRGDSVTAGAVVGAVGSTGDGSADVAHLHVGVRRGDVYLDPATVLTPPSDAGDGSQGTEPEAQTGIARESVASLAAADSAKTSGASGSLGGQSARTPQGSAGAGSVPGSSWNAAPTVRAVEPAADLLEAGASAVSAPPVASQQAVTHAQSTLASARRAVRSPTSASARDLRVSLAVARAARITSRLVGTLGATWSAALLGTLVGLAALWPVMRRRDQVKEQPQVGIASGGSDVAAAAGGC